jgi:hypothetical protein
MVLALLIIEYSILAIYIVGKIRAGRPEESVWFLHARAANSQCLLSIYRPHWMELWPGNGLLLEQYS